MKKKIEDILDQLIIEMNKGKTVDECLRKYHECADELRPLLQLAQQITELPTPEPRPAAVETAIRKAHTIASGKRRTKRFSWREIFVVRPIVVRAVAVILLIFLVGLTTVTLSASSLPGDVLYPVKLFAERVQYFMTVDTKGRARLHVMFADRRTNEFACLLEPGLPVDKELLASMLQATRLAIDHIELLSKEDAAQVIVQMAECNHHQMTLLEKTRQHACDEDKKIIEEAIKKCHEHHDCIECMQNPNSGSKSHCPCSILEHAFNQLF